jgi:hypothetical protein
VRMTNVHAAWRDFAAQDTDLSILKQHFANLFTLPLDSGSVRSNLAVGDARYRQEKCDGENGCRPIHLVRPFRDILISGFSVRALFVPLHRSRQGTSAGEERKSPGRDLLGYHQGRCPHMGSAEPRYQCGVRTFFGNRGITPGCQWPQAGSPRQRMRSGSCGTEGPPQTPSLAPR